MPPSVNKSNAKHYKKSPALTDYHEFEGRDHWTCAAPGWEAVADYALEWALEHGEAARRQAARTPDRARGERWARLVQITHVGGPTVLREIGGWRILTDPRSTRPGARYGFGWGTSSARPPGRRSSPTGSDRSMSYCSVDHHADNLDERGRTVLPVAGTVLTTRSGARNLTAGNVRGLAAGQTTTLDATGQATAVRLGDAVPPRSTSEQTRSGPGHRVRTVPGRRYAGGCVDDRRHRPAPAGTPAGARARVDVLVMHLGAVRFPITGPLRYSMNSRDALRLLRLPSHAWPCRSTTTAGHTSASPRNCARPSTAPYPRYRIASRGSSRARRLRCDQPCRHRTRVRRCR